MVDFDAVVCPVALDQVVAMEVGESLSEALLLAERFRLAEPMVDRCGAEPASCLAAAFEWGRQSSLVEPKAFVAPSVLGFECADG